MVEHGGSVTWPAPVHPFSGPLAGLRILDFSRILAGPFATALLGDLGADIIKVERPDGGDETRRWGPPFFQETAAYFYAANRNRRSLTLDLKDEADRRLARTLATDADVVVENFLPGVGKRLGIDHETLGEANERLVYCTITGYGSDSSRADWPALDFIIQAQGGLMGVTGRDGEPVKAGLPVVDLASGLFATIGILAGLRRAEQTGVGSHIEVALADATVGLLANQAMNWLLGGLDPAPAGNDHPNLAPYETIQARDRPLALAATSDAQFRQLCEVADRPDLAADPRFATNASRVANREALAAELHDRFADEDAATWVGRLNEAGVAASTINSVSEVLDDPEVRGRLIAQMPGEGSRSVPQIRSPIHLDGQPLPIHAAPPALGADDEAIRAALASDPDPQESTRAPAAG